MGAISKMERRKSFAGGYFDIAPVRQSAKISLEAHKMTASKPAGGHHALDRDVPGSSCSDWRSCSNTPRWRHPAFSARLKERNLVAQFKARDEEIGRWYEIRDGKVTSGADCTATPTSPSRSRTPASASTC